MPNENFTQFADGGELQSTDYLVGYRGTAEVKITGANILAYIQASISSVNQASNGAFYAGTLQLNDVFGVLAVTNNCTLENLCYAFGSAPTGTAAIIELLDASNTVIATFTLGAGVLRAVQAPDGGAVALLAGTVYHWKITQVGGTLAGTFLNVSVLT